jgi:hypothetical protein
LFISTEFQITSSGPSTWATAVQTAGLVQMSSTAALSWCLAVHGSP